jgi:class 3 adenylate cyclase
MQTKRSMTLLNLRSVLADSFSLLRPSTYKNLKFIPMVTKTTLVTSILILFACLAGGIAAYLVAKGAIGREIRFAGEQLVSNLSGSITTVISKEGGEGELQLMLNKLLAKDTDGRILDANILNKSFVVLAAKDTKQVKNNYTGPLRLDHLDRLKIFQSHESSTLIAAPVTWGKDKPVTLGYVVFEFSQGPIERAQNRIILWFMVVFLVAITFTVAITRFVLRRFLKPIVKLGEAAHALAEGNLDFQIEEAHGRDEIATATNSFIAMRKAQAVFTRFSNPALVSKILKGIAPDKAEEVKLTICFGDGVKFTSWSGDQTARQIAERLTEYFTLGGKLVEMHGGIVEKFIGDAIMSYFGLGGSEEDKVYTRKAVETIICIQSAFSIANWAFKKFHNRVILQFRFGLATGKCVVGPIGALGVKLDFTIIGSTVNLASRLESIADPGGLAIASITQKIAGEEYLITLPPTQEPVKGFKDPVPVYKVIGLKDPADDQRLRKTLSDFFALEDILSIFKMNAEQASEFKREVEKRLSEPLSLPAMSNHKGG